MDLSSSLSGSKEFRIVKRGYDPDEVDAFLDQIALGVTELKRKLAEANDRVVEAPEGAATGADAEEIHRALILAQRAADEEVRGAREEAERILADARTSAAEESRRVDAEVAAARESGRAALEGEIAELEGVRAALQNDVVVLERHVDEQREVVQAAIGELQSLLDHPDAFRVAEPTGVSDASSPAAGGPPPPSSPSGPEPTRAVRPADLFTEEPDEVEAAVAEPGTGSAVTDDPSEPVVDSAPDAEEPVAADEADPAPEAEVPPSGASATAADDDDDDFLAELRKAMHDEEPLGPRDPGQGAPFPDQADKRSLFGRRR